jgi:hypothetical protein
MFDDGVEEAAEAAYGPLSELVGQLEQLLPPDVLKAFYRTRIEQALLKPRTRDEHITYWAAQYRKPQTGNKSKVAKAK